MYCVYCLMHSWLGAAAVSVLLLGYLYMSNVSEESTHTDEEIQEMSRLIPFVLECLAGVEL